MRIPRNSNRLKSKEEVLDGERIYLPLPILDFDLLFGLGHKSPKSLDEAIATSV